MSIRIVGIIGWICFALDACFIVYLFIAKNAGNDAAGHGVASGFGMVLLPILLAFGGVLWWGMRHDSRLAVITGTILVSLPFIFLASQAVSQKIDSAKYAAQLARDGQFNTPVLNEIVHAIDTRDTVKLRAVISTKPSIDYKERDAAGHTLLGFTVTRATEYAATPDKTVALRVLFESGMPYQPDALEPNGNWFRDLVVNGGDSQNEIVEMALSAGANANTQDRYDKQAMIFAYNIPPSRLAILVKHGADLRVFDEKGWTLLMNAVYFKKWDSALYFLQHDIPVDYKAPDNNTMGTILDEVVRKAASYQESPGDGYDEFVAALKAKTTRVAAGGV